MNNDSKQPNNNLKTKVLEEITAHNITPTSKWFFAGYECVVWFLWVVSVIVGAFAVAAITFVITSANYAFFEATHDSFWSFLIGVLPYIWFVVLTIVAMFAYQNFRHTKTGYRYSVTTVLLSSLCVSVVGGIALEAAGFGHKLDRLLGDTMPIVYNSMEKKEEKMWQRPEEGRLLGVCRDVDAEPKELVDSDGVVWELNTDDLHTPDMAALTASGRVRVLGFVVDEEERLFHACGVFPWMYDKDMSLKAMAGERKAFVERMYAHKDNVKQRLQELEFQTFASTSKRMPMGVCAEHATVGRIGKTMR